MEKILYVSRLCSPRLMEYIFSLSEIKPALSAQKFHHLLAGGFAIHTDACNVQTLSIVPTMRINYNWRLRRLPSERVDNIIYNYVPTLNLPIVKNMLVFVFAFIKTVFWALRGGRKNKYAICDVLNVSVSAAAMLACKLTSVKSVAIVTDLPSLMIGGLQHNGLKRRLYNKLTSALMYNYDGYVLLTEQMNTVVNVRSKPHVIMEGLVDVGMSATENRLDSKAAEKIIIYAGGIYEKYGVKKLIDAFMRLEGADLRLHIYGLGPMANDMPAYSKQDCRIIYFGMVENKVVVQSQLKATLLVNPRSSSEELAKYSFPSKNMEYMVSGTPLATTPLPGMPPEYIPFVYLFDDETVDGFYQTLKTLLSKPREELHNFGQQAKEFVLFHKANHIQAKRLLELFKKV